MRKLAPLGFAAAIALAAAPALAADGATITIKNHKFSPDKVEVPAGKRVKLTVINADATPEEFESHELHVEKIIPGGQTATVYVGPLKSGSYPFVGELHEDTAKGTLTAK